MQLYEEKKQDYFANARTEILSLLPDFSGRVLEIGCGCGHTLEMIKQKKMCAETVGIELFSEAAAEARSRADQVYCMNVEQSAMPNQLGKFDLILLLDVLEHLVDPWTFLKNLKEKHLADHGKMIISLPNARHFSLVLPLLLGRFDYQERGIMDKTHLRFFTKDSAVKLLKGADLSIESIKPTSLDIHLNSGKLNAVTLGLFADFLTSQFIFLAGCP